MRHEPTSGYEDSALNHRVTWRTFTETLNEHGIPSEVQWHTHERIFTNRDTAWDFYQDKQTGRNPGATWEHIPAQ